MKNKKAFELRTELHKNVVANPFGSTDGEDETMDEQNVCSRYVIGLLAHKGISKSTEDRQMGLL
jgi:hypothetical protein